MDSRQTSYQNQCRTNNSGSMNRTTPTTLPAKKPNRNELMEKINQYSFAVNEANLFLDTHPYDTDALAYFQKYRAMRIEAMQEYAKYYAPLTIDYATNDNVPWSWANEPWPWEGVEC